MRWKLICSFRGMTLLFEDESARPIARTKPVPSAFFSLLVHLGVIILLLWLSFSPDVFMIPDNLRRTMLVAPLPPPPPPPPPPTSIAVKASDQTGTTFKNLGRKIDEMNKKAGAGGGNMFAGIEQKLKAKEETFGEDRLVRARSHRRGSSKRRRSATPHGATFSGLKRIRSTICRTSLQARRRRVCPG